MTEAEAVNTLHSYLALRQTKALDMDSVRAYFGAPAQWLVLFGGSILEGAELAARAMRSGAAEKLMLVGGEGHTTQALRDRVHARLPGLHTEGMPEALLLNEYLRRVHGLRADALETRSTNCGNNVSFCLELFRSLGPLPERVILMQDASMQRRMERTFDRVWQGLPTRFLHFASYRVRVCKGESGLVFDGETPLGMWDMERFLSLLMGEISRLVDDENGYGPKGKGFLSHEDVPGEVLTAFSLLKGKSPQLVRQAQSRWKRPM